MYFGKNLNHLVHKAGLKKNALAKELGVTPSQIGKYIKDLSAPSVEVLTALGKYFDINIHDLLLVDLELVKARPFDPADTEVEKDEQLKKLNRLLELRVAELERELKELNPGVARELGIE